MARAARQAGELLLAGEGELRQPRPREHMRAGQQPLDHRPHGRGAEQQRLLAAAPVEHAVGEDVAALEIGAELDLVDGDEGDVEVARHRLDGRDPVARVRRLDLLLAGDQRDVLGADPVDASCCRPRAPAAAAAGRSCRTNAPSIRSIARWVLPVLVGPSTAVTPVPRARASRLLGEENEIAISGSGGRERAATLSKPLLYHNATGKSLWLSCGTSSGTNRARIGDSLRVDFVHGHMSAPASWGPLNRVNAVRTVPAHLTCAVNPRLTALRCALPVR